MVLTNMTKAQFVRETMAKYGFEPGRKRKLVKSLKPQDKPTKSIFELSNERFSKEATQTVIQHEHQRQQEQEVEILE